MIDQQLHRPRLQRDERGGGKRQREDQHENSTLAPRVLNQLAVLLHRLAGAMFNTWLEAGQPLGGIAPEFEDRLHPRNLNAPTACRRGKTFARRWWFGRSPWRGSRR